MDAESSRVHRAWGCSACLPLHSRNEPQATTVTCLPASGDATGHCLPSSWLLTCVPWRGTLAGCASSRCNRRICCREGGPPVGTAGTTAPHPRQSSSMSCSPRTSQVMQMSRSAIREALLSKVNQHLSHSPRRMAAHNISLTKHSEVEKIRANVSSSSFQDFKTVIPPYNVTF